MKACKLGQIAKIQKGTSITKKDIVDGSIPVIAGGQNPAYFTDRSNRSGPVITVSASGAYAGFVIFFTYPIFASDCTTIEPLDKNILDARFLFLCLKSKQQEIYRLQRGAGQPHVYGSDLQNIQIPLPPLTTQRAIAERLDHIQHLIELKKQALAKTDELAKAVFLEMFGDPMTNEKGWEVKKFGEIGKLDRGVSKHRPRNAPELLGGIYPLIQTGDVANSNGYITEYKSTYSELGLQQSKIRRKGTLCITIAANIAKTGILTFDACFPDSVVGFLAYNLATIEYVQYRLSFLQKMLEEGAPESAQKNINLEILRNLNIPLPPFPLQQQFADIITEIEAQKNEHTQALAKLEELYQAEMQRSFSL